MANKFVPKKISELIVVADQKAQVIARLEEYDAHRRANRRNRGPK